MAIDPSIPLGVKAPAPINPMDIIGQVQQLRAQQTSQQNADLETQIRTRQLDEAKKQDAETQQMRDAYKAAFSPNAAGVLTLDRNKLTQGLATAGLGDKLPGILSSLDKADEVTASAMKGRLEAAGHLANGVKEAGYAPGAFMAAVHYMQANGLISEGEAAPALAAATDPAQVKSITDQFIARAATPTAPAAYTLSPGQERRGPDNQVIASVPVKPPAPSAAELAVRAANGDPEAVRALKLLRPPSAAATTAATGVSDVKEAVQGMIAGTNPPLLPGRASKEYTAMLAEAHRHGYDLAGAATDWVATQKHIATMNGAQQLRLNQAINALPDMLDKVDALASQWKGGRFPVLNKANLALAINGTYGPAVASVATQLDAQIADVTADLGNVYMGGNSPTDHALGLAAKSLKAEWDQKVLHDMVKLAKGNVTIRRNSINNTGVQGASPDNPYGQQAPAAPKPTGRFNPATGKVEAVP